MSDSKLPDKAKRDGPRFRRVEQRRRVALDGATDKECYDCGDEYKSVGQHYQQNESCTYPDITDRQRKIITGLLMGDATMERNGINPALVAYNKNSVFQGWVWQELKGLRSRVMKNSNDVWCVRTWSHPGLQEWAGWYKSGDKRFPEELNLTPLIAKVWYCCDGGLSFGGHYTTHATPSFGVTNEKDRLDFIKSLFDDVPVQVRTESRGIVAISADDRDSFLEWMGDPLPGFEYKWENSDVDKYKSLKNRSEEYA